MLAFHEDRKADVTVAVMQVPMEEAHRFGTLVAAADGRVVGFDEKPAQPKSNLISMGIYVFDRDVLVRRLEEDSRLAGSKRDFESPHQHIAVEDVDAHADEIALGLGRLF